MVDVTTVWVHEEIIILSFTPKRLREGRDVCPKIETTSGQTDKNLHTKRVPD